MTIQQMSFAGPSQSPGLGDNKWEMPVNEAFDNLCAPGDSLTPSSDAAMDEGAKASPGKRPLTPEGTQGLDSPVSTPGTSTMEDHMRVVKERCKQFRRFMELTANLWRKMRNVEMGQAATSTGSGLRMIVPEDTA